jgi:hypothetical protein
VEPVDGPVVEPVVEPVPTERTEGIFQAPADRDSAPADPADKPAATRAPAVDPIPYSGEDDDLTLFE